MIGTGLAFLTNESKTLDKLSEVRTWLKDNHYRVAEVTVDWDNRASNEPYTPCAAKHDRVCVTAWHDSHLAPLKYT